MRSRETENLMPQTTLTTQEQMGNHHPTTRRGSATSRNGRLWITGHAIERFQQRVAPMPTTQVITALVAIAKTAKVRPNPRHWMGGTLENQPGTTYLYNSKIPDICLVVRDRCVVTVFTRDVCRRWRAQC